MYVVVSLFQRKILKIMKDFASFNAIAFICNYFIWRLEKSWLTVLPRVFDTDPPFYAVLNLSTYYLLLSKCSLSNRVP